MALKLKFINLKGLSLNRDFQFGQDCYPELELLWPGSVRSTFRLLLLTGSTIKIASMWSYSNFD